MIEGGRGEAMTEAERTNELIRRLTFTPEDAHGDADPLLRREWLVTNGLGGFASCSVGGAPTRRHHALLVSALPTPLGRTVMFNHLSEWVRTADGRRFLIGGQELWPPAHFWVRHLGDLRRETQAHELPALLGVEEVAVGRARVARRRCA